MTFLTLLHSTAGTLGWLYLILRASPKATLFARYKTLGDPAVEGEFQTTIGTGFQLFTRVGNPMFASYLGHLPTYLLFLVDFLRKTNLPTY